ncbi:cobalt-precorrin-6A reductase [Stappia indica]|uniref:Cobalt-precorrin-6A reductase n=1 Tax=Stappia indica TaxID=538381 RepID=A0A857CAL4_9HYPH|nr:cobalt-precorrin-6A reductase [Stappia indica]QGZ35929.1 cobalt-precorrin-6A reductase [Stappia indica]
MSVPLPVLLLAGTGEARALAGRLAGNPRFAVTASLAGIVERPEAYPVRVRIGGFGGAQGLGAWLRGEGIAAVIDATHPFAARISANAVLASLATGIPLLRLERPAWQAAPGDDWHEVVDLDEASARLPQGARPFLAVGRKEISRFSQRRDLDCLMRMIDPPEPKTLLPPGRLVLARPSRDVDAEVALLEQHGATHLVTKNSGGPWGEAKLLAARRLGLPVIIVRRPDLAGGEVVADVPAALAWLEARL